MRVIVLLLQMLSANLEMKHFMQSIVGFYVCFFSLSWKWKQSEDHVGVSAFPWQNDYLDEVKNE